MDSDTSTATVSHYQTDQLEKLLLQNGKISSRVFWCLDIWARSVLRGDCCVICNLFVTTDEEMLRVLSLVSSTLQLAVCQLSVAPRHPNTNNINNTNNRTGAQHQWVQLLPNVGWDWAGKTNTDHNLCFIFLQTILRKELNNSRNFLLRILRGISQYFLFLSRDNKSVRDTPLKAICCLLPLTPS